MKRKLLYCYYDSEFGDSRVNDFHFRCLKKYIDLFDEILIYISTDDTTNDEHIKSLMSSFINIDNTKSMQFKVVENSLYVTSEIYKNEVVDNFGNDEYLFFAHNKGFVYPDYNDTDNAMKYVYGLYYFTLEHINDVYDFFNDNGIVYGSYPSKIDRFKTLYKWNYNGGFQWINMNAAYQLIQEHNNEIPEIERNEYYYEDFFSNYIELFDRNKNYIGGYVVADSYINYFSDYVNYTKYTYGDDGYAEYIDSYNSFINSDNVEIIYTCIGDYVNYADEFLKSLKNFLPHNKKYVTIITDSDKDFSEYVVDNIVEINKVYKPMLIYPCINIHKTMWIQSSSINSCKYVFYFDADTIINENIGYDWNNLLNHLDNDEIAVVKHQGYLSRKKEIWKFGWFNNVSERNRRYKSCITDYEYTYIISSFFGGKRQNILSLCEKITSMEKYDLGLNHIPPLYDENYFNELVWEYETNKSNDFTFYVDYFSQFGDESEETKYIIDDVPSSVFMKQKNMEKYKTNKPL